jgi:hypothetical protein
VRGHADAIARLAVREVEEQPPRLARRLLKPQIRWAAERRDEAFARELGVLDLVERARDRYLAALDADEGLAALLVPWEDVVDCAAALVAESLRPRRRR